MNTRVNNPAATEGTAQYYAEYLTQHADKKKPVILRTGSRYHVFVFKGDFWDMSSADGRTTQYDLTTDEAADVLELFYKDAQRAPLYKAEEITRTADGIDRTADGLEFRAVVVGCESREIEAAFLTLEDAHAAGWYGFKLDADPAEVCNGSEGYRGGRLLLECCREEDAGTFKIAYGETYEQAAANYRAGRFGLSVVMEPAETNEPAAIAASEEEGAPLTEPNRDGLPDWLHVGTRFCLLDFVTGKPTAVRYTCAAIDYENKTVTIPEARDSFRNGSTVYRWDAFHWATFAPVTDDTDPTPDPSGEIYG